MPVFFRVRILRGGFVPRVKHYVRWHEAVSAATDYAVTQTDTNFIVEIKPLKMTYREYRNLEEMDNGLFGGPKKEENLRAERECPEETDIIDRGFYEDGRIP